METIANTFKGERKKQSTCHFSFFGITGKNGTINHSEMVIPWANQSKLGLYLKMCAPKLYAY